MNVDVTAATGLREPITASTAATGKEKALWLLEKLVPGTGVNNLGLAVQAGGRLRAEVLAAALAIMLGRHDVLRTVFRPAGGADLFKWTVPAGDFRVAIEPIGSAGGTLEERLIAFTDRPFPLDGRPLIRAGLVSEPDGDVFCLAVHHLAFDMVSMALFMREFLPVYDAISGGRPLPPAGPATVPADAENERRPEDLAYWRETLHGYEGGRLDLWCGATGRRQPVMAGGIVRYTFSPEARQALLNLQRVARAPVAAVLLAAYAVLLASHGAGPDIVIGSPVDVRGANAAAIGYHVNVVPLRIRVDFSAGFRALARQARDAFLGAMAHAALPVDELAGELPHPLFRHLFNFLPAASLGELSIDGGPARLVTIDNPYSKFDLELVGTPSTAEIWFRYARDVLAEADVEAMLGRFETLLIQAAQDADRPVGETVVWRSDGTLERPAEASDPEVVEPVSAVDEELVAVLIGLWRELLDVEVDAHTSFFEAGGHSLLAAVLAQKVEDTTGISVPLPEIFANPTPIALAAQLRA